MTRRNQLLGYNHPGMRGRLIGIRSDRSRADRGVSLQLLPGKRCGIGDHKVKRQLNAGRERPQLM